MTSSADGADGMTLFAFVAAQELRLRRQLAKSDFQTFHGTAQPARPMPVEDIPAPWHGTSTGYCKHRCRCPQCRQWNTDRTRRRREAKAKRAAEPWHGTFTGYTTRKCRCVKCRGWYRANRRVALDNLAARRRSLKWFREREQTS